MRARSTVQIRDATPADVDVLVTSTLGNAWESEGLRLNPQVARQGVQSLLADPRKGRAFVAECHGKFAGSTYVTFEWSDWHAAWYWWIQSAYTVPEFRGKGVWTQIFTAVQQAAKRAVDDDAHGPVRAIRLYVESSNDQGLRAYRGHGMKHCPYEVFEQVVT